MSGQWPPEWEDPEEADQPASPEADARLSEVSAYLASIPAPVLPEAVESRISGALDAEAARRAASGAPGTVRSRTLGAAPSRARVHRWARIRPSVAAGSLVVCLLLAGLGYVLGRSGSAGPANPTAASGSSATAGSTGSLGPFARSQPAGATAPRNAGFLVTESGTRYQPSMLASQVKAVLARGRQVPAAEPSRLGPSVSAPGGLVPSPALAGCVRHFTGDVAPQLVDRASYDGKPAYVIASADKVWVVGLGCTAAKPELVAAVPLAGLPGNLRALVSVEG